MFIVFSGSDRLKMRDSVSNYIEKNMPNGATLTTLEGGEYETGQVANALGANSLFGGEEWFVFDNPADNLEFSEEVKKSAKELSESNNTFLILEDTLLAPAKKIYSKYATDIFEFKGESKQKFNIFVLADALANRDKKKLWVLVQEAKLAGVREEEIIGILWWQLKSLRLATITSTASEAGMSEFPYSKAKRALTKFKSGETNKLSQQLLELYHDGHAGVRELDNALEQWVLTMV